ncbi:MAG TPA: heavy metal-binding domain-containing protein [Thermoanaerobaculia bacterium]|nr:heavy metal-binding domain-containing protein [Thermoanaerobaculia bacterium]
MKYDMRRVFGSAIAVALLLVLTACGGKETVASKSAKAFREAQAKGVQVGGGAADHHGGAATDSAADAGTASHDHSTMAGMDHSTMTGMDHSTMTGSRGDMAGMDHSKMNMPGQQPMAGMDHSKMNMQGRQPMAGMDHSKMNAQGGQSMAGMDHSKMNMPGQQPMAGMDHSKMNMPAQQPTAGMDHSNMPGMQHGAAAPAVVAPPTTNAEMQQMRPATTLRPDAFDAPVPVAVAEAAKSVQGGASEGQHTRGITPGQDHENPPTPAPATRDGRQQATPAPPPSMDHSQHAQPTPATPKPKPVAATIYTCPMHPDVTSDKPGSCPRCGMTLVRKK